MKRTLLRTFLFLSLCCSILVVQTNANGPGSGYTNAPGESACTASGCHTGSLVTSGAKHDKIKLITSFTGNGYIPDSTYTLYVTYKETSQDKWGFQMTALDAATSSPAGSFSSPDSRSQTYSYTVSSKTRSSIGHTSTGTSSVSTDSVAWKITWKAPSTNMGNIVFYMVLNVADGNGQNSNDVIYAKQFTVGPSSLLPVADFKISESLYCSNAPLTFDASASTGSPTSFWWRIKPPSGADIVINNQSSSKYTHNFSVTGTYKMILFVKNTKGVSANDTLSFTIIQGASLPLLTPNGLNNICEGDSLQIAASSLAGHTFLWSPQGQNTRIIKVADSGIYSVTAIASNGCQRKSTQTTTVVVNAAPTLSILKSFSGDTICAGTPFSLGTLVTSGTADSFSFVSQNGPFSKSDTVNKTLSTGPQTFTVWGKSPKGCVSAGSSTTIQVETPEAAPVLSSSNIGFTGFTVNWSAVNNASGYKVSIDSGKTFITPSSGSTGLSHDVTGLLGNHQMKVLVYATTPGNCANSAVGEITVTTLSCTPIDFDVNVTGSGKVCKGNPVMVSVGKLAGKNIGIRIDGINVGNDTLQAITVNETRDYDISVIDSTALICGYTTKTVKLTVDSIAAAVMTPSGTVNLCSGTSTQTLVANVAAHSSIDSVYFFQNGIKVAAKTTLQHNFTVKTGDSVWAVAKNTSGCMGDASAKTYAVVNANPSAAFNISNVQFDYTFTAQDTTGTHSWKVGADSTNGNTLQVDLTASKNDSITITHYIVKNGCRSVQSTKIFVPDFSGVKLRNMAGAKIYPNPAADRLHVFMPKADANAKLDIYNAAGALVLSARLVQGENEIITETLASGTYLFRVHSGFKETTGSIMIER